MDGFFHPVAVLFFSPTWFLGEVFSSETEEPWKKNNGWCAYIVSLVFLSYHIISVAAPDKFINVYDLVNGARYFNGFSTTYIPLSHTSARLTRTNYQLVPDTFVNIVRKSILVPFIL